MTVLSLKNVSMQFNNNKPILNEIDYDVQSGDFIILLGSNGSGKSTLLKLLYRYYQPHAGNISFLGIPLPQHHAKTFAKKVAVITQNCNDTLFTSLTLYENYLLAKEQSFLQKTDHAKERAFLKDHLKDYNENLCDKLDVIVDKLSGGEKQVLALALCFINPPALLLLDEHTSALDPKTSAQIMMLTQRIIYKHNITCILTTHDLDIALTYGNRILLLANGKIKRKYNAAEKHTLSRESLLNQYF